LRNDYNFMVKTEKSTTDYFKLGSFKDSLEQNISTIYAGVLNNLIRNVLSTWSKVKLLRFILLICISILLQKNTYSQLPDLGTTIDFALFTSVGALGNTGTSDIYGNIGSHVGAITGFDPPTVVIGNISSADAVTAQCLIDVQAAYDEIVVKVPTVAGHAPAFGGGETLVPGIYNIGGAGSIFGDLTLDAGGFPSSIFIFQFGGAFDSGATSEVHLINGTSPCNVFWIAEGAMSLAALTIMKGTLISNNGAISMGAGADLEGRMLTTGGAANVYNTIIHVPCASITLPINLLSFTGHCDLQNIVLEWSTASEINNDYFSIENSKDGLIWNNVGRVSGAGNSSSQLNYTFTDSSYYNETTYYKLKQTDFDGTFKYEQLISVSRCKKVGLPYITIYPNPSSGNIQLLFNGNSSEINSITILNALGQRIYHTDIFQSSFDLSYFVPGVYTMNIQYNTYQNSVKFIIAN